MSNATMWTEMTGQGAALAAALPELRRRVTDLPRTEGKIFAGGCGDSWFAAQATLDAFAEAGLDYRPASALELAWLPTGGPRPGDLAVLVSISGGTARTVEAAERLSARGVETIAVSCTGESALDSACTASLVLPYRPISRATPHTADYLVSLLALVVFAEHAGRCRLDGIDSMLDDWDASFDPIVGAAGRLGAEYDAERGRLVALGGLGDLGTAGYGVAKFHEAGGLHAVALESENAMHGANFTFGTDDLIVPIAGPTPAGARAAELASRLGALAPCRPVLSARHVSQVGGAEPLVQLDADAIAFPFLSALALQGLCWSAAERVVPDLEAPRAGREGGARHAEVQTELLKHGRQRLGTR